MKYRKKPVVIDAVPVREVLQNAQRDWYALPQWVRDAYDGKAQDAGVKGLVFTNEGIHVSTLEGVMLAQPADWLIRGIKGEVYACKPDIFDATYETVE